jgi:mRNA interferase HicA
MRYNELLRRLKDDGWFLVRTKKHQVYKHPVKKGIVTVPKHGSKEIPDGTLNSILKQAGLK